jgi:hypothetical protein
MQNYSEKGFALFLQCLCGYACGDARVSAFGQSLPADALVQNALRGSGFNHRSSGAAACRVRPLAGDAILVLPLKCGQVLWFLISSVHAQK